MSKTDRTLRVGIAWRSECEPVDPAGWIGCRLHGIALPAPSPAE